MPHVRVLRLAAVGLVFIAATAGAADILEIRCEEVWDAPGETEDYLLGGLLVDAGRDHDGRLCVVDYKNKDLKIFDSDGNWLRTLGRQGSGPGECRDARRLLLAEDGRLGLLQVFPACIVWLQPDGTPGGRVTFRNTLSKHPFVATPHMVQNGSRMFAYATGVSMSAGDISEEHWIVPVSEDGVFGTPCCHQVVEQPARDAQGRFDEGDFYDIWAARWAPDGHGGVWVADRRDLYRITRHDETGAEVQRIERPYEPVRRDPLGRRLVLEHLERKRKNRDEVALRDTAPVVRSLRLADDGDLWADLDPGGHGPASDTIALVDVFDDDGEYLRRLHLHGPYDPEFDQWRWVDDRHLLVLHTDEDGEVGLRLLRLVEPDA